MENKQVKEIYDRWNSIWETEELPLETRLNAYSILKVIEVTSAIYEKNITLDEEDVDDLFIAWNKDMRPTLPEEMPEIMKGIEEELKKLKNKKGQDN